MCKPYYLSYDQVSNEFRESFILAGYRKPNCSFEKCFRSIFYWNNETLNFWTHFIPFLFVLKNLVSIIFYENILNDTFYMPLLIYLVTVCFYLLMSSVAHMLNCMSSSSRHICFILDYMSISVYGMGSAIAYKAYTLPNIDNSINTRFVFDHYVWYSMWFSLFTNLIACESRFIIVKWKRTILRIIPFILQYLFIHLPLFYELLIKLTPCLFLRVDFVFSFLSSGSYLNENKIIVDNCVNNSSFKVYFSSQSDKYYLLQFIFAVISAIFYVSHIPERFWPGKFDIIGQSHHLFHLSTFACSFIQFNALYLDLNQLKSTKYFNNIDYLTITRSAYSNISIENTSIIICFILFNAIILTFFYFKAVYFNPWNKYSVSENRDYRRLFFNTEYATHYFVKLREFFNINKENLIKIDKIE